MQVYPFTVIKVMLLLIDFVMSFSQKPDPIEIIELPLRAQVMVAQTQAGMWRRNGYALLNQVR